MTYTVVPTGFGIARDRTPIPDNGKVLLTFCGEYVDTVCIGGLFYPVKNGKAVIGLKEKYMTPATVKVSKNTVEAFDDGTLLTYVDGKIKETAVKKGEIIEI